MVTKINYLNFALIFKCFDVKYSKVTFKKYSYNTKINKEKQIVGQNSAFKVKVEI